MKGIVFREFLNMTEERFGDEVADIIITNANLPNQGAYTSVGTYNHEELVRLLLQLSKQTSISHDVLLKEFGQYVFQVFLKRYQNMFSEVKDGFSFLSLIENTIHTEVLKLYPEAELPTIDVSHDSQVLKLRYSSKRKLSDFAEGLILGCLSHFKEDVRITKEMMKDDGSEVLFTLTKN